MAEEFKTKLKEGKISSCSVSELAKYIEALSNIDSGQETDHIQRASQLQTLNTLYNVKVMEKFNKKNTRLTYVVIILAVFAVVIGSIQIYISYQQIMHERILQSQQIQIDNLQLKKQNVVNEQ